MGKIKQNRNKLHVRTKNYLQRNTNENLEEISTEQPVLPPPSGNLFPGLNINFEEVQTTRIPDDVRSVRSFKSLKSNTGMKQILKKDKFKIRRQMLLKKIDAVNQMKLKMKVRQKRKKVSIMGDTNPLHDALPSLQSLLKPAIGETNARIEPNKNKGTKKASKRMKEATQGVKIFKQTMGHKDFKRNPFEAISRHISLVVEHTKLNK